jgi:hypothetical protein
MWKVATIRLPTPLAESSGWAVPVEAGIRPGAAFSPSAGAFTHDSARISPPPVSPRFGSDTGDRATLKTAFSMLWWD